MRKRSNNRNLLLLLVLITIVALFVYQGKRNGSSQSQQATSARPDPSKLEQARIGPKDIYPNASLTPGATDADIAQDTIQDTICNPHWSTRSIRPPVHYTDQLKREQLSEYGYADTNPRDYEEDHLIPLELGGNPTDPKNLWPEPYVTSIADGGAHAKDHVESYLHRQVCDGALTLGEAQQEIASDWYGVYIAEMRAQ
jgi:hypothetical protein